MTQTDKTPVRSVRVDDTLWLEATLAAVQHGETVTDVIRRALLAYVDRDSPTMSIDYARAIVLNDVRRSYGPDEMTDEQALAHAADTDPRMMDPSDRELFDAYRIVMTIATVK